MQEPNKPNKTEKTIEQYRWRQQSICRMGIAAGYVADAAQPSPLELAQWLVDNKASYCAATTRQYRASIKNWIETCPHADGEAAIRLLRAPNPIRAMKRGKSGRTSSTKAKTFPRKERLEVVKYLRQHPGKYTSELSEMIMNGALLGLRPCEWSTAHLARLPDGSSEVSVRNAKHTNSRGNGEERKLIVNLPGLTFLAVAAFLEKMSHIHQMGEWERFYGGCRKTMYRSTRAVLSKRNKYPTIYSLRHQFAADAKSAGLTKEEIGALMGHASELTAGIHYGKKKEGQGKCAVNPSEEDLARLRARSEQKRADATPGSGWG